MNHLHTFYMGTADTGIRTDPARSHVIRMCKHTAHSYATLMSMLSPPFFEAQRNADEGITNEPYHITILWPLKLHDKRKEENSQTSFEIFKYYLSLFKAPRNGAIVSIYHCRNMPAQLGEQWRHSQIWPFARQWDPQGTHVTVHRVEPNMSSARKMPTLLHEDWCLKEVKRFSKAFGYEIRYVDYTQPIESIIDNMTTAEYHFSYLGATWFTAAQIGIPSLAWHNHQYVPTFPRKYRDIDNNLHEEFVQQNAWGSMSTHNGKIRYYDHALQRVINKPNQQQLLINSEKDIMKAFEGIINND